MMDNEKKPITERIADTVKSIVDSTTETAMQPFKPSESNHLQPDPQHVAGEANEQIYIPEATDAVASPVPLVPTERNEPPAAQKGKRVAQKTANKRAAKAKKAAPSKKTAPSKNTSKEAAKKPAKKFVSKRTTKKASKKLAVKKMKKGTKRGVKKKAKRG